MINLRVLTEAAKYEWMTIVKLDNDVLNATTQRIC